MAWLREVVVVIVAEFGVVGVTTWTLELFLFRKLGWLHSLECCWVLHPRKDLNFEEGVYGVYGKISVKVKR